MTSPFTTPDRSFGDASFTLRLDIRYPIDMAIFGT